MEFLSESELHSYQDIIDQIQAEHEKYENLKSELDNLNNALIIANLSKLESKEIAHLKVKIFSDIVELFSLYGDKINHSLSNLAKRENSKFYLLELFITESLQKKIQDLNCSVWFLVTSNSKSFNRTVKFEAQTPIIEIVVVDKNIIDCVVSASLVLNVGDDSVLTSLDSVSVDISYHFEKYKNSNQLSMERKIIEISKCYPSSNLSTLYKPLFVEHQFKSRINIQEFARMFIQNCYNNIDLELLSDIANDRKNVFAIKFRTGTDKHLIMFDKSTKIITIKSNIWDMVQLKNYFWRHRVVTFGDEEMKKNLKKLRTDLKQSELNKDTLCKLYVGLRRIWIT